MSFPLPVGTEGAPAPTGPGWPPLSPETLRDMAVTLAVLPNPRAFEGEPAGSGRPCSCPYPSACLGGDKGHCGVHVYVPSASPQLRGRALRPRGAGSKATSALCRTLVWDKHRAPGSSAHAALPTATLWPLREGRCAAAWWVWIPGSPGGWGTGDSPGQGHAGSRGAVHTGHGPRRPRTWGQGEPRAGPGGS